MNKFFISTIWLMAMHCILRPLARSLLGSLVSVGWLAGSDGSGNGWLLWPPFATLTWWHVYAAGYDSRTQYCKQGCRHLFHIIIRHHLVRFTSTYIKMFCFCCTAVVSSTAFLPPLSHKMCGVVAVAAAAAGHCVVCAWCGAQAGRHQAAQSDKHTKWKLFVEFKFAH